MELRIDFDSYTNAKFLLTLALGEKMNLFETFKCLGVADGISSSFYNLCFSHIPL